MPETNVNTKGVVGKLRMAFGYLSLLCGAGALIWILYGEINLWVKHSYTIGQITKKRRGNKFEPVVDFTYMVDGKEYERGAEWDGKARVGDRYVVKYAVYAPYGNKLYYQYPVPDSVQQDTGRQWHEFMQAILLY